jgi:hypothetical protein
VDISQDIHREEKLVQIRNIETKFSGANVKHLTLKVGFI